MSNVWLVTGCSSGFGRAIALAVIDRGDTLIATARDASTLADLVELAPDRVTPMALDVTDAAQIRSCVNDAISKHGRIDVLVNNAGAGLIGALEEITREQIDRSLAVNLLGPIELMRAVLPHMRAQKSGWIVNMSAAAAINNYAGFSIYGGAKAALETVSEAVALEAAPFGVKVTLVQPGPFRTEFASRSMTSQPVSAPDYAPTVGKFATLLNSMRNKQPGDPQLAARAIVALRDEASPPLRLVLGKYAAGKSRKMLAARLAELETWEPRGQGTEFAPGR
jgi:NAD(P)-dependent dehydrogenase (short-subunit alcohol dehydrogenase family)